MNIAVIGTGGVGEYFGGKLTKLPDQENEIKVYFIAGNAHLEVIKKTGYILILMKGNGSVDRRWQQMIFFVCRCWISA